MRRRDAVHSSILGRVLAAATLAWLLVLPASVAAFPSKGPCTLELTSNDAKGNVLDTAKSGDDSASPGDPLVVDWEGTVSWTGTTTVPLKENHYHVAMFGMATPFQGGALNGSDARSTVGTFGFTTSAPFRFTGLYYLTVGIIGSGGECTGSLVVKLVGDPIGTVPFFVGLALLAIGLLLLVWGFAGHLGAAVSGGLILGMGAALEVVIFSFLPLAGLTPISLLATGLFLSVVSAVAGGRRLRQLNRQLAAEGAAAAAAATALEAPAPVLTPPGESGEAEIEGGPESGPPSSAESTPEPESTPGPAVDGAAGPGGEPGAEPVPATEPPATEPPATEPETPPSPVPADASSGQQPEAVRPPDDPWPAVDLPPDADPA
jgi:type II secretory pathway pseudopilin PulG